MDKADYRDLFVTEAQEYLGHLNDAALKLERNDKDLEAVHTLFRAAHTLKGMAATMGYEGLTRLCHDFESALDQIRSGAQPVSQPLLDLLFEGIDALQIQVQDVASGGDGGEAPRALLEKVQRAIEGKLLERQEPPSEKMEKLEAAPAAAAAGPEGGFPALPENQAAAAAIRERLKAGAVVTHLRVYIDPKCTFKGVRAFLVIKGLEKVAQVLHTLPASKDLQEGKIDLSFDVWVEGPLPEGEFQDICRSVIEITEAEAARLSWLPQAPAAPLALPTLTPVASGPGAPAPATAQIAVAAPSTGSGQVPAVALAPAQAAAPAPDPAAEKAPAGAPRPGTIRVNVQRLDRIMDMVGELVTSKIRLTQIAKESKNRELSDTMVQVDHVVDELQQEAMAARMVPMEQVFSRFPRMVRDLARDLGKEAELLLEGGEIEVDRTILDEITDPMVHLLRNAVDHGLEMPAERALTGKPKVGTVRLHARRERNQIVITVEDDGSGIHTDRVRAAAVRKGLLSKEDAEALSEEEAINLIALPGFSTASKVTEVSGRGVGIDAVRTKVEKLGGGLRIESRPGQGSSFRVRLPLTLAIIQALQIKAGNEEYLAPVANVVEAVEFSASELKTVHGQEVVMLREEVLPVFRLGRLLEVPGYSEAVPSLFSVLVVEAAERRAGVLVDEVVGQIEIAIKGLGRFLKALRGFGGVTILGDGRICLILDFASLLEA